MDTAENQTQPSGSDPGNKAADEAGKTEFNPGDYVPKDRYTSLEKKLGSQGSELGAYRKQVDILTNQLERMMSSQQKPAEAPKTDYDAMKKDIAAKVASGDLSAEDGLTAIADWTAKLTDDRATDAMERAMARMQEQLDGKFKDLESQKIQERFLSEYPDFMSMRDAGEFEHVKAKNPMFDDIDAYFQVRANRAESALAEFKKKIEDGAKPTGPVIGRSGQGMRVPVQPDKMRTPAERDDAMLKAAMKSVYGQ